MAKRGRKPIELKFSRPLLVQFQTGEITLRGMAEICGVSVNTVSQKLRSIGIPFPVRYVTPPDRQRHQLTIQLAGDGWSGPQIAERLGISRQRVHQLLAKNRATSLLLLAKCGRCGVAIAMGLARRGSHQVLCARCLGQAHGLSFGQRLRLLRWAAKFTQEQLAFKCTLSAHTIHDYESGKSRPTKKSLRKLAEALGVREAALAGRPEAEGQH
jgi:transcriptional regulator with XRE-family HTH domain